MYIVETQNNDASSQQKLKNQAGFTDHCAADRGAGAQTSDRRAGRNGCGRGADRTCRAGRTGAAGHAWGIGVAATTADTAAAADVAGRGNSRIAAPGPAGCRCVTIGRRIAGLAAR